MNYEERTGYVKSQRYVILHTTYFLHIKFQMKHAVLGKNDIFKITAMKVMFKIKSQFLNHSYNISPQ